MIPLGDETPRRSFPIVTVLILAANVLVFLYELTLGEGRRLDTFMLSMGVVPVEITTGIDLAPLAPGPVYITLLTSMFIHGGFLHIASNMLYLWVFGDNVEDTFGHVGYFVFYLVAGILASLTQVASAPASPIPSVGASGAIAGVLGAYLIIFPHARVRTLLFLGPIVTFPRLSAMLLIGFWFLTQLFSGLASLGAATEQTGGVAVWAHIGGFVAGVVMALVFRPRTSSTARPAW